MAYDYGQVTVGTVMTQVMPNKLMPTGAKTICLTNRSAATFVNGIIEWSHDGVVYGTLDGTTFANAGSASALYSNINNALPYIRVRAAVASGSTAIVNWAINY